jgi:putative ATP-dependent endonuclease of the OLD family
MADQASGLGPSPTVESKSTRPTIYHLAIKQFRGVEALSWHPAKGVNLILGGGDVGKTTILDAIGLLLSPTNTTNLSDTDYHLRNIDAGFVIEAVLSLPPDGGINGQFKASWPWEWNGNDAVVPNADAADGNSEPVYRLRVRGTEDLELAYEIVQPDGTADSLPVALRRSIGLVRLSGDDRSDRDLRLVQGSALDRLLSDKSLRSRIASQLAKTDVENQLTPAAQKALEDLDDAFEKQGLPDILELSITGGPGPSIASLIGLTADCSGVQLPLANWGAGTRRLAALAIAEQHQGEHPITLVDEIERGLEPYRQRSLVQRLQTGQSQVFITTHSPAAIAAASNAALWYVDHDQQIGPLDAAKIARHRATDPDTFLSRLAIICEGITEVGFVTALLERAFGSPLQQHGIHLSDGGGHDNTVLLLEALVDGGIRFGGFADDEGRHPGRWEKIAKAQGLLVFRWEAGCIEQNVIGAVPEDKLEELLTDPEGKKTGPRLRTLQERLGTADKDLLTIKAAAGTSLKPLIIEAAIGAVPSVKSDDEIDYKAHPQAWFKTTNGGRELAAKMFSLGVWPAVRAQLLPFCNAVRQAVDLPEIADVAP